jgi:hypothetical protein
MKKKKEKRKCASPRKAFEPLGHVTTESSFTSLSQSANHRITKSRVEGKLVIFMPEVCGSKHPTTPRRLRPLQRDRIISFLHFTCTPVAIWIQVCAPHNQLNHQLEALSNTSVF